MASTVESERRHHLDAALDLLAFRRADATEAADVVGVLQRKRRLIKNNDDSVVAVVQALHRGVRARLDDRGGLNSGVLDKAVCGLAFGSSEDGADSPVCRMRGIESHASQSIFKTLVTEI